jgi:cobalt/nickel transport protein
MIPDRRAGSPAANRRGRAPMATRRLLAIGLAVAILIGVAAVFLASSDPDGLESTALVILGQKSLTAPAPPGTELQGAPHPVISYSPPFPDYSPGGGSGHPGSILAIVFGICLTFGGIIGLGRLIARSRKTKESR